MSYNSADKRELARNTFWDAIIITLSLPKWRNSIERECQKLTKAGLLPAHNLLLVVEDPQPLTTTFQSVGVGSGGATLNGLLVVAERLSALEGYTTINPDILQKRLILMIHFGRSSHHLIGGNAFIPVSCKSSWLPPSLSCPVPVPLIQNSIWMASVLASQSSYGIWLASMDFYIPFSTLVDIPDTKSVKGVMLCSLKSSEELKFPHGIISANSEGIIQVVTYMNPFEQYDEPIREEFSIISGSTFVSPCVAETIVALHTLPPLDRCTYYGTDSDTEPVQISLYFDLLLPLCQSVKEEEYVDGELSINYASKANYDGVAMQEGKRARHHIWSHLRGKFRAVEHYLQLCKFSFLHPNLTFDFSMKPILQTLEENGSSILQSHCANLHTCRSVVDSSVQRKKDFTIHAINCHLGPNFTMECDGECVITNFHFPDSAICAKLGSELIWQMWPLDNGSSVTTCHGFSDNIYLDFESEDASIFNIPFTVFLSTFKLDSNDLWDARSPAKNFFNAKLFPLTPSAERQLKILEPFILCKRYPEDETISIIRDLKSQPRISFREILTGYDMENLLRTQDTITLDLIQRHIKSTASHLPSSSFLPLFSYAAAISFEASLSLLRCFHAILETPSSTSSRLLANVADLLGCIGGPSGGLRSGPASNREWASALQALKKGDHKKGIELLLSTCLTFTDTRRPEKIIRASRHYERASQILISKQVETANEQVFPLYRLFQGLHCLPAGVWVRASCPARLDLAGGWTDTPPVCYEQGGAVLNVAIKVNGQKPIIAKARITSSLEIICILKDVTGAELKLTWTSLDQLRDYDNPVASGALIKAVLIYTNFVNIDSKDSLQEQLSARHGGGLEIIVSSELAHGSGLGGSSLIAGTLLGALAVLMGFTSPTVHQLIHATLGIEQMLTTGGGWQDQIGGLVGGVKLGTSNQGIPLVVKSYSIPLTKEFHDFLNTRLMLLYTGKVRLARNLLQTVLRNWYAREATVTESFSQLRKLAFEAAEAVLDGNGPLLGSCINQYWMLKKTVASGCEPAKVSDVMGHLRDKVLGQSLAGAGGGGYLYAITREPVGSISASIREMLEEELPHMHIDAAQIDTEGLTIEIGGETVMRASGGEELTKAYLNRARQSC